MEPTATFRFGESLHHGVCFYNSHQSLCGTVAHYLHDGFRRDEPGIVVATPAHRHLITEQLVELGTPVDRLTESGSLLFLDAQATLDALMSGGAPQAQRFRSAIGGLVQMASLRGRRTVRAYGEMVDLLWRDGSPGAAIGLETLWNQLAATHRFSLLCGYAMERFRQPTETVGFCDVCAQHTHVLDAARPA